MTEIRLVNHLEEMGELIDLFGISFGHNISKEMWNWKYIQNPLAKDDLELVVAMDKNKIVGARPFLITEMWVNNNKVKTAQHCDTMVHPDYRNQGIFNRMGKFAIQHLEAKDYAISYGLPNLMSRPGFLRQGYQIVVPTEIMFRPINPSKLITHVLHSKILGSSLGILYNTFFNARRRKSISQSSASFNIKINDQFTGQVNGIDDLRDKSVIELVRSESNLRWRFDKHPEYIYKYVTAKRNGTLWGYAVVSVQEVFKDISAGIMIDYLVKNRDSSCFRILLTKCLEVLEELGCDIEIIWAYNEPSLRELLLGDFGFKSSFIFPYNKFYAKGYLDALLIDKKLADIINIYDEKNWRVTPAFHDAR